jgi:hypothetical protein
MNTFNFKALFAIILQVLGAMLAFVVSLIIANLLLPLAPEISAAGQTATGFLAPPLAFLFNALVNGVILVWAARRSSFRGMALFGQLLVLSFGAQVFMTQIETGYFLSAFPQLRDNFQLYNLVLRGLVTSLLFCLMVTALCGGFAPPAASPGCVSGHGAPRGQARRLVAAGVHCALLCCLGTSWPGRCRNCACSTAARPR